MGLLFNRESRRGAFQLRSKLRIVFSLAAVFAAGYGFRRFQEDSCLTLPVNRFVSTEDYLSAQSFSEVDQAKLTLEALGSQALTEFRVKHNPSVLRMTRPTCTPPNEAQICCGIQQLEREIQAFRGTEQQFVLTQELLYVLKHGKRYDLWLDVFLRTLYGHPTEKLINYSLRDAQTISQLLGREAEFHAALAHLGQIPFEFPAKAAATVFHLGQPADGPS